MLGVDCTDVHSVQKVNSVACTDMIFYTVYGQSSTRVRTEVSSGKEFLVVFMENYVEQLEHSYQSNLKGIRLTETQICLALSSTAVLLRNSANANHCQRVETYAFFLNILFSLHQVRHSHMCLY